MFRTLFFSIFVPQNSIRMGKRQERIKGKMLPKNFSKIEGREVNVIQRDGITVHGYVIFANNEKLILEDLRYHKHEVPISNIAEVVVDTAVEN
ncbi:MAG: hypothetical protein NZ519_02920 [Bacteroidia bacterium]|nr:hypothetical protein [Bacteroidia bacterium]MDW8302055.1 hypothetical protein [Bacteroidia bacterium]